MADAMNMYNDPAGGDQSTIGATQFNTFKWHKKAIIDSKKEMFFSPLADSIAMPKHYGKKVKVYQYVPLLDDRNVNDQGIDAAGVTMEATEAYVTFPRAVLVVANADKAAAVAAINDNSGGDTIAAAGADNSSSAGFAEVTITGDLTVKYANETDALAVDALDVGASYKMANGNLYGSSRDVGTINSRIPTLTETGGRVNRVGFTRLEREGSIIKLGFFQEFTQESFDFDTDEDLYAHMSSELVKGATQMSEMMLQNDLLAAAGVTVYAGGATSNDTVTAEGGAAAIVDYDDLDRLHTILFDNRTPTQTKVIAGSRLTDTKTIAHGRVLFIGSELETTVKRMTDPFSNAAFIPVQHYADAATILNGEIGSVGHFRIVVVPEMSHWAGAGAAVGTNPGYRATSGRYDVFPMLVVGGESFSTIGFQTDGKTVKFKIMTKMPGEKTADRNDPYGETGFSSIKWYYGSLIMRPERIAVIKTVARQ